MPTPSLTSLTISPEAPFPPQHSICPPDSSRSRFEQHRFAGQPSLGDVGGLDRDPLMSAVPQPMTPPMDDPREAVDAECLNDEDSVGSMKLGVVEDKLRGDTGPQSPESMVQDVNDAGHHVKTDLALSRETHAVADYNRSADCEFSSARLYPNAICSFLRAGSRYKGTQRSDNSVYEVQVDIKHVDLAESFLCGYLRITGLTPDHPTLTTYFEGEMIGSKYSFMTRHPTWGATSKTDLQHWAHFPAWRPLAKSSSHCSYHLRNFTTRENIFMRWKEQFLIPDHRVRAINGASFEGFYYICFNQIDGHVSGIYFHAKSDKFQKLELDHVPDKGVYGAVEFR